jgi:membrane fusion protein (multidrug efflux system)
MTQFEAAQTLDGAYAEIAAEDFHVPASTARQASEPKAAPRERLNYKKLLRQFVFAGVGVAALAGAADLGWRYWTVGRFQISTDDAYVKADNTTIAPKVAGYIAAVLVGDNERVKAGQILARIDDRDFKVAVEQAKADVQSAKAAIANK